MNLKLHLLIRMTLMGFLCWLGVSIYVVGQSGRHATRDLTLTADQLQMILTADVMRRSVSLDADARRPDLGGAAVRFPEPLCLRYRALDASETEWGCNASSEPSDVPRWIGRMLTLLGPETLALQRPINVYGIPAGTLQVESDATSLLQRQWKSVRELLELTAVTLLVLDILAFWVIGRALRPTAKILAAVEQLGAGANDVRLPRLRPREFTLIANGVNRLAMRLADAFAARARLTARLIRVQEDERRELAHELHEEFGQCVSALSAVSASIRHGALAGEALTDADLLPLEATIEKMMSSLRGMLQRMSLPPLAQQGLRSALADLVAAWQIKLHGVPRIEIDTDSGTDRLPSDENALCAYRIVQECLSNIARHAPTSQAACVYVRHEAQSLKVRVSNDLRGVSEERTASGTGMGLQLLGERVRSLHGQFSIERSAERFTVQAILPLCSP